MTNENHEDGHKGKKTILEILNETFQWLIFGSILLKKGGGGPLQAGPGEPTNIEIPGIPAWVMSAFHFLTTEDEQEYVQIIDAAEKDPAKQEKFFAFKNNLVQSGYDEDFMRLMLVNLNRDWLNRKDAKKTDISNSAKIFIEQIILLDPDYVAQKKLAKEKKFLKKVTTFKKLFILSRENKLKTVIALILAPFIILSLAYHIINLIFG